MIILGSIAFFPASDWSDKVTDALQQFGQRFPQEKVYLHLDKDYYASGETIWFKAYIMVQGMPSVGATNLYVELLDKNGTIVMKKRLVAGGAAAIGDFELPESQKAGQYQLRAYTAWMLNFDAAFLCYRNIEVFEPQKRNNLPDRKDTTITHDFAVQFFPEGGDLLNDISSRVAFKAIDQSGYPVPVSGKVLNSKGKTIATIETIHDGMGAFELTPAAGENYHAIVKTAGGLEKDITLPASKATGAGLKIFNRGVRIFYQAVLPNPTDTSLDRMLVVAQMQQQLVYKAILKVSDGRISGFIPTDGIPSGILQVTLFDVNGVPLSERLVFVRKKDQLTINLTNPYINTEERQRNSIDIEIPDTLHTSLSVAVTDADQVVENPDEHNIISELLLSSDLKGYIYNPAWYFRDSTKETVDALDLVMMTNGWRRFNWAKIINNDMPQIRFPYEQGILIKGTAFSGNGRVPLPNGKVDMILKHPLDSTTDFTSVPTNDRGEFVLTGVQFMDTLNIYYKGGDKDKKWKDVTVKFNSHFFDNSAPVTSPYPFRIPAELDKSTLTRFLTTASENNRVNRAISNRTILLKEVNIREKKIAPQETTEKRYTSGLFSGGDGYTFDLTQETVTSFNVFQYLQSKVAGLQITGDYSNPSLSWRGGTPSLFLNEMPVDKDMVSSINVNDIALIKVFRPPFMGGFGGSPGGAIAIYTKKGGDNKDETVKGFELYKKGGYNIVKEFYSPDYSVRKEVHALADKRLTLYWNPRVQIDSATHRVRISFYNNDFSTHFRVVVEGIAEDGRPGRVEEVY
ncbi:MG2 domain-containing protein [Chitinophaga sp. CF118]|uniref:MG2 domain-containing protein n=1 Tax=Chitinophaga sp. CF118 TaxID=1884367 RepID=UPI0008E6A44E|nr:MG2 domain-containing protein [Chitinophaga sp. CF118]SFD76163.1 MG2 domain-containing protein [Chitinophaga sp. CF118]